MTDPTAPAASPDTFTSTEQAEAPTQAPASRAERRARAVAAIEAKDAPAEAPAAKPEAPESPAADETPAQTESREDRIAARLKAQREAREAKAAAEHKAQLDRAILARAQRDDSQVETRAKAELRQAFERDPVATAKDLGMSVPKLLELLTKDAISPGSVRAQATADDGKSEAQRVREEMQAFQRQLEERDAVAAAEQRRTQFIGHTADAGKWPLLSKLDPQDRLEEGIDAWTRLSGEGHEYDPDLVADLAEARLERRAKKLVPAAPEVPKQPQAAVKRAKTITPALASERGAATNLSRAERKARIVAELERANAARSARSTSQ